MSYKKRQEKKSFVERKMVHHKYNTFQTKICTSNRITSTNGGLTKVD